MWTYYSRLLRSRQRRIDGGVGEEPIGDISSNKAWIGLTLRPSERWFATLLGRGEGRRSTVSTNPIPSLPGYAVADLNLGCRALSLEWGLKVQNLLDRRYAHPGIRDAGAGDTPGAFNGQGEWVGSRSYYSSLLPQPGRQFLLTLKFNY